jgi:23S rRNA (pseudouridine1915-N3)-methyltransferase
VKLRFLWPASKADPAMSEVVDAYLNRIKHFYPVEVVEIRPGRGRQNADDRAIMRAQSARLLEAIPPQSYAVALDERGETIDSLRFARWIERLTIDQPHGITFVMGGDVGLDESVRKRADKVLSLSPMTLPHLLARVVLVEQIYRACTLIRNIAYHK